VVAVAVVKLAEVVAVEPEDIELLVLDRVH
jgi:uncharacterized protein YccT (UPF0319 family)